MSRISMRNVAVIFSALIVVAALVLAARANAEARDTAHELARVEHVRAVGACKSSTDLRALFEKWVPLLETTPNRRPETVALEESIKQFTATNPNCVGVDP